MKGRKAKGSSLAAERCWVSLRVTRPEKLRIKNQSALAGLSASEYLRRNFFGGKPLIAHTDLKILAELRRIGGLLKHNFTLLREAHAPLEVYVKMDDAFDELIRLMEKISRSFNDSQKD